jgi:histidinol-phosphate aminotransferase
MTTLELARACYRDIDLYAPDRSPCAIDLSDNTNLWGIPPAAELAIRQAPIATVTRYPSLYAPTLKRALADYAGVEPDTVVTGCGSDDVLDSAIRAFAEPGDRIAYPDPSFAMIPIFARMNGLEPVAVPLSQSFDVDADAFLATDARVIYLCSPNNPTGNVMSAEAIERIIANTSGVVILDAAYSEFGGPAEMHRWTEIALRSGRTLISRTMSKAFGLAGLRVGYGIASPALAAEVEKSRGPYKVNAIAERAAVTALREDVAWVNEHVALAIRNRELLSTALATLGLAPLPSASNFVLVPVHNAAETGRRMRQAGVAVRPFPGLPHIGDALRISVGPWEMMETCIDVLGKALAAND